MEMRDRLLHTLKVAASDQAEEDPLAKAVRLDLDLDRDAFKERSQSTLKFLLHSFGDLNIGTIDQFNLKIIRSFARDLRLPMNFEIEMQQEVLLERVISNMLSDLGNQDAIDQVLLDYSKWKITEGKSWKIEKDLFDTAKQLYDDHAEERLNQLKKLTPAEYLDLIKALREERKRLDQQITQEAEAVIALVDRHGLDFSDFNRGKTGVLNHYYKRRNGRLEQPSQTTLKAVEENAFASSSTKQKSLVEEISPQLIAAFHKIEGWVTEHLSLNALVKNLPTQALIAYIHEQIEAIKQEEQLLNIADFNQQIGKVVQSEPLPFIYERIGERFYHIMIDEFQDTSTLQFQNLLPLIDETLANGRMSLIVGDAKQSIYRFRGGELEQFSQMPFLKMKSFAEGLNKDRLKSLQRSYKLEPLAFNYRSSAKIIEFNNLFFGALGKGYPVHQRNLDIFEGHHQEVPDHASNEGFVELKFMPKQLEGEPLHLQETHSKIEKLLARGFKHEDVAILCRKNAEVQELAEYLSAKGIPILSDEALRVANSDKVKFLIALLQLQMNPRDSLANLIAFDFLYEQKMIEGEKSDLQLIYIAKGGKGIHSLCEAFGLSVEFSQRSEENLLQWVERQLRQFALADQYDIYLQFFEEQIFQFQEKRAGGTEEFLSFWHEQGSKAKIDLKAEQGAVQLLSIHKSKGLEFPIVIMPFMNFRIDITRMSLWVDRFPQVAQQLELALINGSSELSRTTFSDQFNEELIKSEGDLLNLLYVAFTRAERELHLISEPANKSNTHLNSAVILNDFKGNMDELDDMHYTFGKAIVQARHEPSGDAQSEVSSFALESYHSSSWREKVSLSLEMSSQWLDEDDEMDSRRYGSLLHEILARIYTVNDIEPALEAFWRASRITAEERDQLAQKLSRIIASEELQHFFDSRHRVKNEASLLSAGGEILRPDKLVFREDKTIILDYKSGAENDAHREQLQAYAAEVERITNKPVEALLYYLSSESVKKVA